MGQQGEEHLQSYLSPTGPFVCATHPLFVWFCLRQCHHNPMEAQGNELVSVSRAQREKHCIPVH